MGYYLAISLLTKEETEKYKEDKTSVKPHELFSQRIGSSVLYRELDEMGRAPRINYDSDSNDTYEELTSDMLQRVISERKDNLSKAKDRLLRAYKVLSYVGQTASTEHKEALGVTQEDIDCEEEYIKECEEGITTLEYLLSLVEDVEHGLNGFGKVLMNAY